MSKTEKAATFFVAFILLTLTAVGSFYDYEISSNLYMGELPSENIFGIIFAFIGVIPTFVGWSFLGASLICFSRKDILSDKKRGLIIALSILLFILSFFYFCNTLFLVNENAFSVHFAIAYSIGVVVIFLFAWLGYTLTKPINDIAVLKKVLFLTLVSLLTMALIMATKGIMDRPRFRFVYESKKTEFFRSWWESGKDIKKDYAKSFGDEFSSFPSGHSAYSMFAIFIFPLLADLIPKLKNHRLSLFVTGFAWWGLTAFSRITVGAHYLSDVCIAALVTISVYATASLVRKKLSSRKI